jgi:hypothetical protein
MVPNAGDHERLKVVENGPSLGYLNSAVVAQLESAPASRWEYVWFKSHPLRTPVLAGSRTLDALAL